MHSSFTGHLDEALAEIKRAQELDPLSLKTNSIMWGVRVNMSKALLRSSLLGVILLALAGICKSEQPAPITRTQVQTDSDLRQGQNAATSAEQSTSPFPLLERSSRETQNKQPEAILLPWVLGSRWPSQAVETVDAQQGDNDVRVLKLNEPIERELSGGQSHAYQISLAADQFLYVLVDQRGIDVVVALFDPNGKRLTEVDSPNGTQGPEPVYWITETSGIYKLEVRSLDKDAAVGRYEAKIGELRTAKAQDKSRVAANQIFAEGEQLRTQQTAESLGKAIEKYEEALAFYQAAGERNGEAVTLNNIGSIYDSLNETSKALDYLNQALLIRRTIGDRSGEAVTLINIGGVYYSSGERQKALDFYNQALPLARVAGARDLEAGILTGVGLVYQSLGEYLAALTFHNQALAIFRAIGDRGGEAATLHNIGAVYNDLGEEKKAIDFFNQALPLWRVAANHYGEAGTLHNIGLAYNNLGENQKALDFYRQALPIRQAIGDRAGEALTLGNIGLVYADLGEKQKALDLYDQALKISRAVGDRAGEAANLRQIAMVYSELSENQKALDFYNQTLPIMRALGDHFGEAITLFGIARVERDRGNLNESRILSEGALNIIESLSKKLVNQDLRSSYFATVQTDYNFYIDLLMRQHQIDPSAGHAAMALKASERARTRSKNVLCTNCSTRRRNARYACSTANIRQNRLKQPQRKLNYSQLSTKT